MVVDLTEEEIRFIKILLLNKDNYATDSEKLIIDIITRKLNSE